MKSYTPKINIYKKQIKNGPTIIPKRAGCPVVHKNEKRKNITFNALIHPLLYTTKCDKSLNKLEKYLVSKKDHSSQEFKEIRKEVLESCS